MTALRTPSGLYKGLKKVGSMVAEIGGQISKNANNIIGMAEAASIQAEIQFHRQEIEKEFGAVHGKVFIDHFGATLPGLSAKERRATYLEVTRFHLYMKAHRVSFPENSTFHSANNPYGLPTIVMYLSGIYDLEKSMRAIEAINNEDTRQETESV